MEKLLEPPDEDGYSVRENSATLLYTDLDGGPGRTRLDVIGGARLVTLQWSGGKQRWKTVKDFFSSNVALNCPLFLMDLMIDDAVYQEYRCNIIPQSINSKGPIGLGYSISAQFEVLPIETLRIVLPDEPDPGNEPVYNSLIVFKTSFECANVYYNPYAFVCEIGSLVQSSETLQTSYVKTGNWGIQWSPSNSAEINFALELSAQFDIIIYIKIPIQNNWYSGGNLFRANYGGALPEIQFLLSTDGTKITWYSLFSSSIPQITNDGQYHKMRFYCTGPTLRVYQDNFFIGEETLSVPYQGGDTSMLFGHPGYDYYFGKEIYGDDLVVTNDPTP